MINGALESTSAVWVVVAMLHGQPQAAPPVQLITPEPLCRGMAAKLPPGSRILGWVDGKLQTLRFLACWRTEDGYLVEEVRPRWRP